MRLTPWGFFYFNNMKKEKIKETYRKKGVPMFQSFEDAEDYAQHFDAVLNTIPKKKRYVFATFMLRLQQSIREGRAF